MKSEIEDIYNSSSSFGKFNAILFFRDSSNSFLNIYKDIFKTFNTVEIKSSLFDLDIQDMKEIEAPSSLYNNNTNSILRTLFINEVEEISLEYYKGQFIVEHLFWYKDFKEVQGYSVIKKIFSENVESNLILGYELSININDYTLSLEMNTRDEALYPIIVTKKTKDNLSRQEFIGSYNNIGFQKIKLIQDYLELIINTSTSPTSTNFLH